MTDPPEREAPTAEERAMVQPFLKTLDDSQLDCFTEIMRRCSASERAAVAAERERCANEVPSSWFHPLLTGENCIKIPAECPDIVNLLNRIREAIRKEPTDG